MFSSILVGDTKIISDYDFVSSLKQNAQLGFKT